MICIRDHLFVRRIQNSTKAEWFDVIYKTIKGTEKIDEFDGNIRFVINYQIVQYYNNFNYETKI